MAALDEREDDFFTFAMARMLAEAKCGVNASTRVAGLVPLGEGCLNPEKEHFGFENRSRTRLLSAQVAVQATENIIDTVSVVAGELFRGRREPEKVVVDRGVRLANRGDVIAKGALSGV